ncbi:hypothetical protein HanIR_Chr09g0429021 [Helianthus annuus]|nr:hypothetical protein HanIR_Chr09g0429021 [Helianthus annuus]
MGYDYVVVLNLFVAIYITRVEVSDSLNMDVYAKLKSHGCCNLHVQKHVFI